mmetsp:Transcript_58687/g.138294  ORF Transcript_58687/g.138294 Transcript_58687/m.138294 type:complete len:310 (+) Transcript_58687:1524-2453(+)
MQNLGHDENEHQCHDPSPEPHRGRPKRSERVEVDHNADVIVASGLDDELLDLRVGDLELKEHALLAVALHAPLSEDLLRVIALAHYLRPVLPVLVPVHVGESDETRADPLLEAPSLVPLVWRAVVQLVLLRMCGLLLALRIVRIRRRIVARAARRYFLDGEPFDRRRRLCRVERRLEQLEQPAGAAAMPAAAASCRRVSDGGVGRDLDASFNHGVDVGHGPDERVAGADGVELALHRLGRGHVRLGGAADDEHEHDHERQQLDRHPRLLRERHAAQLHPSASVLRDVLLLELVVLEHRQPTVRATLHKP